MDIARLSLAPSLAAWGVAGLGILSLVIWWLVRKRQKRVWLPVVRILNLDTHVLPKLVWHAPSWLSFFCFLLAALVLFGFSLRPRTQIFTPFEPNQTRVHIFVDMSPSVAAELSIEEYATRVAGLYESLQTSGRMTLSTSHGLERYEPQAAAEVKTQLLNLGFHRAGVRLGTAMKQLLEEIGEIDRLFIVSDHDQHSWMGFNWQYLLEDTDVRFIDVSAMDSDKRLNAYIDEARFMGTPTSQTIEWDVEIGRRGSYAATDGQLTVTYYDKVLGTFPFRAAEGRPRQTVHVSWTLAEQNAAADGRAEDPLVFRLQIPGDNLSLDDEFRALPRGTKQDVLLVSEPTGERYLDDPSTQLQLALQVLGFNVRRQDFLEPSNAKVRGEGLDPMLQSSSLLILAGGSGSGEQRFCPLDLLRARLSMTGNDKKRRSILPKVWLAPTALGADYKDLCRCYSRLVLAKHMDEPTPSYCESVESREQWTGLLQSLGAKQIGGDLGDAAQTFAWLGSDSSKQLEVMAFTVPLTPSIQSGISYAKFPILVRELLVWQQILQTGGGNGSFTHSWPRIEDIAASIWHSKENRNLEKANEVLGAQTLASNIPAKESAFLPMESNQLPPRWMAQGEYTSKQLPAKKDREDPLPWLKLAAWLATAACAVEALGLWFGVLWRRFKRPPLRATQLLLLFLLLGLSVGTSFFWTKPAEAKVQFNLLGYGKDTGLSLQNLARDVAQRTSIELATRPDLYTQLSAEALLEPWLWVRDLRALMNAQGHLRPELIAWVKRGGFLIIEAGASEQQLRQLTADLLGARSAHVWQPLPPDHELLRSFYLLDALPTCNKQIWQGLHFDDRLAVLSIPYEFLGTLKDSASAVGCENPPDHERSTRIFVNLVMVALATDYKKDQIHLPEILKRLR